MNYFDLHCDTATEAVKVDVGVSHNGLQLDLAKLQTGRLCQSYAVFIPDTLRGEPAWQYFLQCAAYWERQIGAAEEIELLRQPGEAELYWQRGCHAAFLSVEGGAVLAGKTEHIEELAVHGVRMLTLTWNGENELGSGAGAAGGLKPFGRAALREMERCGIAADVSHLNDESFWEVEKIAQRPLVASHSNSRRLCGVPRNLTDDQFRCIAERGGLVGLNFYTGFLRSAPQTACMEDILRHAEHFLALDGEDTLALGSDFDGATMPADLSDAGALPRLAERLTAAFGRELAEKICYRNALAFWRRYDAK